MNHGPATSGTECKIESSVAEDGCAQESVFPLLIRIGMAIDSAAFKNSAADKNGLKAFRMTRTPKFELHFLRAQLEDRTSPLDSSHFGRTPRATGMLRHHHGGAVARSMLGSGEACNEGRHISHHSKGEGKLAQLKIVEDYIFTQVNRLFNGLEEAQLLDDTLVIMGSGMSDASTHSNKDLPVLLAGGGLKHQGHLPSAADHHRVPLCNLWLSALQWFGLEREHFGKSTSTFSKLF